MDVIDGFILFLVLEFFYNFNKYYNYDVMLFKNWVVMDVYEFGFIFKLINVVLVLEVGVIEEDSVFYDIGRIRFDCWFIFNFGGGGGV